MLDGQPGSQVARHRSTHAVGHHHHERTLSMSGGGRKDRVLIG
jgi:hypothetical protein